MTLKEIEKIIDESDCYWLKRGDWKLLCTLNHEWTKLDLKRQVMCTIENGYTYVFMKLKDNGEVENRWIVDHIDKEKKIIKKKLSEMTEEEIKQVMDRFCDADDSNDCADSDCPFAYGKKCLASFPFWKKLYEDNKDKEFEVEIEVENEEEN